MFNALKSILFGQARKKGGANEKDVQKSPIKDMFNIDLSEEKGVEAIQLLPESSDAERIAKYKQAIGSIPMPPLLWDEFQQALKNNASNDRIANIIKSDSVLSGEVLKSVNTSAFGLQKPINDVGRAISHMGHTMVRGLVAKHCFSSIFPAKGKLYDLPMLWKHGMAVSALAEIVGESIQGCDPAEAGTIGLFHDVGRLAFNLFPDDINQAFIDYDDKGYLIFEAERFGCTHIDLGEVMANHWHLPEKVKQGIKYHHMPGSKGIEAVPISVRPEVLAVYLADLLCIHLSFAGGNNAKVFPHFEYQSMLKKPLKEIMHEQAVSKELWRINCIEF